MKIIATFAILANILLTPIHQIHAMQSQDVQPMEDIFPFSYSDPNRQDAKGNTFLYEILCGNYFNVERNLQYFLTSSELNLNIKNHEGHTPLIGLFSQVNIYDQTAPYLACVRLYLEDERTDHAEQQNTLNRGMYLMMDDTWPSYFEGSDNNFAFFNRPLMEYVLPMVNDLKVLNEGIEVLTNRIKKEPGNAQEIQAFLEKVIAQKNKVAGK